MTQFDPKRLTVGDIVIFRKAVFVREPVDTPSGVATIVSSQLSMPTLDMAPNRFLTSSTHVTIDSGDPDLLHVVVVLVVVPDSVIEYQENVATEARIRAMESIEEEIE
jgi:hypothetical protein